jgi:hypothetical protein
VSTAPTPQAPGPGSQAGGAVRPWTDRQPEAAGAPLLRERLVPGRQPTYVASWTYAFGVLASAALIVALASGAILSFKGPAWWHVTGVGHFFNSIHLWAVELFFVLMVLHLWAKYWTAAWRGGRSRVWIIGAISFLVSLPTAMTGYLSQQNFDAQWLATQAKNGLNSIGAGAFFNVTDFGQMYSYHVLLLPLALVLMVAAHVLLVRRHGLVPPFELEARMGGSASPPSTPPAVERAHRSRP